MSTGEGEKLIQQIAAVTISPEEEEKEKKMITLKTSDDQLFVVEEAVISQSQTIKHLIEDNCAEEGVAIPIHNVNGPIMAKVIEYCKKHVEGEGNKEELKKWDEEFLKKIDTDVLHGVIQAASYLTIDCLLNTTTQHVVDTMIKGKSVEQIRATFGIKTDFTPEEEEEIRRENAWAFD